MRTQSELLNTAGLILRNFRRANVLRTAAGLRIQKRVLVREIIETSLGNDLKNRQCLIAQNSDGQFAARNEFLDQQFRIVLRSLDNRVSDRVGRLDDVNADGRSLSRRFDHKRWLHSWIPEDR